MIWTINVSLILLLLYNSASDASKDDDYSDYNAEIYQKYIKIDNQLKNIAEKSVKQLIPYLLEAREHVNVSTTCSKNLFDLINGFRRLTSSSFKFLDAMGKIQRGIKTGNLHMFGEFEECIETEVIKRGMIDYRGQYCAVLLTPLLPKVKGYPSLFGRHEGLVNATRNSSGVMKQFVARANSFYGANVNLGICVPTGCSKEDMSEILKYSLGDYINITVDSCFKKEDIFFWTKTRIVIFSIFVLFGVAVVVSTILDNTLESWKKKNLDIKSRILQCFSLTRNFPKLLDTAVPAKDITCIHGIRVLTISWIIYCHEYIFHIFVLSANHLFNFEKMFKKTFMQIIWNGYVTVDIFFFVSGFVSSYTRTLNKQAGKPEPGLLETIRHRLWRIYPAYIAAFLFTQLLLQAQPHLPTYRIHYEDMQNCENYWWRNFLFIHNFFSPFQLCMLHTWFLSVDMQLFLVTLFTLPILVRKPKMGIMIHIAISLVANICSMAWYLTDDVYPLAIRYINADMRASKKTYHIHILPPIHIGSYFIGIIVGYIIAAIKKIKIPKGVQVFGWLTAGVAFNSMLFVTVKWTSGNPYTALESALYGAWSKTIGVLAFSWLVLCCATGHARLFNYILSLKLWIPLSKISYMIYLLSPTIQNYNLTNSRFPKDFSDMPIFWDFIANLTIIVFASAALVLIVEWPILSMERILFPGKREKSKSTAKPLEELASSNINENGMLENGKITIIHL